MARPNNKLPQTNFENNWRSKTLENLEKDYWGDVPKDESYLITTCHQLRKKQLRDFSVEDLRMMIGQSIGLRFLIPLAIETLEDHILAEGDFYEGDLLKAVLTSDRSYWKAEAGNWHTVVKLFRKNKQQLETAETTREIRCGWLEAFADFEKIN